MQGRRLIRRPHWAVPGRPDLRQSRRIPAPPFAKISNGGNITQASSASTGGTNEKGEGRGLLWRSSASEFLFDKRLFPDRFTGRNPGREIGSPGETFRLPFFPLFPSIFLRKPRRPGRTGAPCLSKSPATEIQRHNAGTSAPSSSRPIFSRDAKSRNEPDFPPNQV